MRDIQTLHTYNESAEQLAGVLAGVGSRENDIEKTLDLLGKNDGSADVLEIGCGDGRDAVHIVTRVASYTGIDYSSSLIELARKRLPEANLQVTDMETFTYPDAAYDAIFAFASLVHLDRKANVALSKKVAGSLRPQGLFFVSLKTPKTATEYTAEWLDDAFGKRLFYYYTPEFFTKLTQPLFEPVYLEEHTVESTHWFKAALQKKNET
jgi:ubiquinone/menaquinone biosynthesis C-methylase UbiE